MFRNSRNEETTEVNSTYQLLIAETKFLMQLKVIHI